MTVLTVSQQISKFFILDRWWIDALVGLETSLQGFGMPGRVSRDEHNESY